MGWSRSRALAGLVFVVTLAGCGSSSSDQPSSALATTVAPGTAGPLAFRHAAVGGGEIDFSSYAGKPVALWFWAPY